MSKRKTEAEIKTEIKKMKDIRPKVRPFSAFGGNNLESLDAQIRVLEQRMTEDQVMHTWDVDETSEEFEYSDFDLQNAALDAVRWMKGEYDDGSLTDGLPLK